jgi:hypothetical protein
MGKKFIPCRYENQSNPYQLSTHQSDVSFQSYLNGNVFNQSIQHAQDLQSLTTEKNSISEKNVFLFAEKFDSNIITDILTKSMENNRQENQFLHNDADGNECKMNISPINSPKLIPLATNAAAVYEVEFYSEYKKSDSGDLLKTPHPPQNRSYSNLNLFPHSTTGAGSSGDESDTDDELDDKSSSIRLPTTVPALQLNLTQPTQSNSFLSFRSMKFRDTVAM